MRGFVLLFAVMAALLALTWSAAVGEADEENAAVSLFDVNSEISHSPEGVRQVRQFGFGRPYGGYGGFGRPYGGYGGFGRPYGGFGGFGRPYGGYGGFRRPYGGYGGYYG